MRIIPTIISDELATTATILLFGIIDRYTVIAGINFISNVINKHEKHISLMLLVILSNTLFSGSFRDSSASDGIIDIENENIIL